ncbi:PadR family transcriptional regulator [Streptosporangiaceae bacterium NEAU-GS5]|nr:PadR family transcriptional regulator [Streptosporangiaceae bacterium NEAU-GS5]
MTSRRKVSNLLGLAVLAALRTRPMHPYEVAGLLREWGKDNDMKFKWGSLYTVVGNLEKHGFIKAVGSSREGRRPERTVYALTAEGRAEAEDWVRDLVGRPEPEFPRFKAALSVLGVLHPDEATRLLNERLRLLDERVAAERAGLAALDMPRVFLIEAEYDVAMRQAEADWIRSLLGELRDGTLTGAEAWREYYATGQLPPDWSQPPE